MLAAVAETLNVELSAISKSYVQVPVWFDVPLTTVMVGRTLSSCAPSAGKSAAGFVSVGGAAGAGVGLVGDSLPPLQPATTHASTADDSIRNDFMRGFTLLRLVSVATSPSCSRTARSAMVLLIT